MTQGLGTVFYHPELSNIGSCRIGSRCTIHSHVWIGNEVTIGDDTKVQAFVFIPTGVKIGNSCFIGPRVTFTNDKHPPSHGQGWSETHVEDEVVIGAGAVILPGITLGRGCMIGAGAVVTKSVPPGQTWVGNPAKPVPSLVHARSMLRTDPDGPEHSWR